MKCALEKSGEDAGLGSPQGWGWAVLDSFLLGFGPLFLVWGFQTVLLGVSGATWEGRCKRALSFTFLLRPQHSIDLCFT